MKSEEILTCLILVAIGYFIAQLLSRCAGRNGFRVGAQGNSGTTGSEYGGTPHHADILAMAKCTNENYDKWRWWTWWHGPNHCKEYLDWQLGGNETSKWQQRLAKTYCGGKKDSAGVNYPNHVSGDTKPGCDGTAPSDLNPNVDCYASQQCTADALEVIRRPTSTTRRGRPRTDICLDDKAVNFCDKDNQEDCPVARCIYASDCNPWLTAAGRDPEYYYMEPNPQCSYTAERWARGDRIRSPGGWEGRCDSIKGRQGVDCITNARTKMCCTDYGRRAPRAEWPDTSEG